MKKFPRIETKRLVLEEFLPTDIPQIVANMTYSIARNTLFIPFPYREEDASRFIEKSREEFFQNRGLHFAIRLKENMQIIGAAGINLMNKHFRGEIGFWLSEDYWNSGIATETAAAVIRFCFEKLNLHKVFAYYFQDNKPSGRVLEKCGMKKEGLLRDHVYSRGRYKNLVIASLLKKEFEETMKKR